jgi:hypothetical protein
MNIDDATWVDELQKELEYSRLPPAIQGLTRDMVDNARVNALILEAGHIIKKLRNMSRMEKCVAFLRVSLYLFSLTGHYRRKLLEARRDKHDYEAAKRSYDLACGQFQAVLVPWNNQEQLEIKQSRQGLEQASQKVLQRASGSIDQAIANTLQHWMPRNTRFQSERTNPGPQEVSITEKEVSALLYGVNLISAKYVHRVSKF